MTRRGGAGAVTRRGAAGKEKTRTGRSGAAAAPATAGGVPAGGAPAGGVPIGGVPVAATPVAATPAIATPAIATPAIATPARADVRGTVAQIVTFRIEQDLFAADVRAVERVLRPTAITPVRNMPPWISGVLEYQKRVVPVIDFRARFELPAAAPTNETRVLVFNVAGSWVAAVVDAVLDVSVLEPGRLDPPPPLLRGLAAGYLRGIVRRDGKLVMLLDADRILSATERLALGELAGSSASIATSATTAPVTVHG
jgi:purine-binding chemotaxis protein CheW